MTDDRMAPTWKDLAKVKPEVIQLYVQEKGPLPDGPVEEEDWNAFMKWLESKK